MNSGLSLDSFKKGLAGLLDMGLATIRREERAGKRARRIIQIGGMQTKLRF